MKKIISIVMIMAMLFSLAACGQAGGTSTTESAGSSESTAPSVSGLETTAPATAPSEAPTEATTQPTAQGKTLIVYFSWSSSGNTEKMASVIKEHTGGDILKIEPAVAYPTDYSECGEVAKVERDENARPEIANLPNSLEEYDTIFIGYPIWNADMPYIMYTFFETYDFSGKTIVPFNTHGGSGFSGTQETIAKLEPNATMLEGKSISRNSIEGAGQEIIDWLQSLGMMKDDEQR